jgi:hypothetical protein
MPHLGELSLHCRGLVNELQSIVATTQQQHIVSSRLRFPPNRKQRSLSQDAAEQRAVGHTLPMSLLGQAVSQLASLEKLGMGYRREVGEYSVVAYPDIPHEFLHHLRTLPSLTEMHLNVLSDMRSIDAIRAIPTLRILRFYQRSGLLMDHGDFLCLMAEPAPKLTACELIPWTISPELVPALLRLADTLTDLNSGIAVADLRPFLPRFTSPVRLILEVSPHNDLPALVEALQQMTQLQDLTLWNIPEAMTSQHLAVLLQPLARLQRFRLVEAPHFTSLSFLKTCSPELRQLRIVLCRQLDPLELHHLRRFRHLEALTLDSSFTQPLDRHAIGMLTPESVGFAREFWPNLKRFLYIPLPRPVEVEDDEEDDK